MITTNLQYFGGRGAAGNSPSTESTGSGIKSIMKSTEGSVIKVENFSSITGKPTGEFTEYTLHNGRWSSVGKGSFDNNSEGFSSLNSIKGVVPKIERVITAEKPVYSALELKKGNSYRVYLNKNENKALRYQGKKTIRGESVRVFTTPDGKRKIAIKDNEVSNKVKTLK